jgi:pimeloyl-ACP methyl ester carboxylesterase
MVRAMFPTIPMRAFDSDGVEIAYFDEGEGEPILLIHGFASNAQVNWVYTGWVQSLKADGRRVVALDNRGHGRSAKLHDPAAYAAPAMAEDARRLLDHLGLGRADVMGYSMGARIAAFLALDHPDRVRSAVFGGLGIGMIRGVGAPEPIAEALEAPDPAAIRDPVAQSFRAFADQTRSDRLALAACIRASRQTITPEMAARIAVPVLVAVGTKDSIAGSAAELAALIPGAEALDIPNRDHMLAVGDRVYKAGVLEFLRNRP